MQTQNKKWFVGALLFIGIIVIAIVIANFVRLYTNMPSKAEVLDVANGLLQEAPVVREVIEGSLVPQTQTQTKDMTSDSHSEVLSDTPETTPEPTPETSGAVDWLTPGQRQMLRTLGVDESSLPAVLTPELEACFVSKIGQERVDAIKGGDTPTLIEGMRAVSCL